MRLVVVILALAGITCADVPVDGGESMIVVARQVTFAAREEAMGEGPDISVGLDLDEYDTQVREEGMCFLEDFVSPDGRVGVDNAFTFLFELVESFFQAGTVEGIIQGSINEGRLLMMFELSGVDDWRNDEDVTLEVLLGEGRPDIGGDGFIVSGQTFDRDSESESVFVRGSIRDGVLETEPFEVTMPMAFFNVFFDLNLHGARVRASVTRDGSWSGVLAGGMTNEDIVGVAREADMLQEIQVADVLSSLLPAWSDLGYDAETGTCSQLSATLLFDSTLAFVFDDAPPAAE